MIPFWFKVVTGEQSKLTTIIYVLLVNGLVKFFMILIMGLNFVWQTQCVGINKVWLKNNVNQFISDHFMQNWSSEISNSSKHLNYRIFKTNLCFEKYHMIYLQT